MEILFINKSTETYYTFPFHSHGYWEIILNLSGEGIAEIEGETYPFEKGTIFCIPEGVLHRKKAAKGFMDACIFVKDYTPVDNRRIAQFEDDANQTFLQLFQLAFDLQLKDGPKSSATVRALGDVMYQLMVSWSIHRMERNILAENFQNILLNNITNSKFDIAEEIKRTGYCSSYFRKTFSRYTGYPPLQYLLHLRVEYAKRQLQQYHNVHTIKQIALASGFTDPYYFSRVFKNHEGVSPEKYIRNLGAYDKQLLEIDRLPSDS